MATAELITVVQKMLASSPYPTYLLNKLTHFFLFTVSSVSIFLNHLHWKLCGFKTDVIGDQVEKTALFALFA